MTFFPLFAVAGAADVAGAVDGDVAIDEDATFSSRGASAELNDLVELSPLQYPRRSSSTHPKQRLFGPEKPESEVRNRLNVRGDAAAAVVAVALVADAKRAIRSSIRKSTARAPRRAGALRR